MSRELDCRDCDINKVTADRETELNALAVLASERLSGSHRVRIARFDALTGNSASVKSEAAFAKKGDYIQRALDHVRSIGPVLGLSETQPVEFAADPVIQKMTSGAVAVHLQQQYQGVPIFQASETVRFSPDGKIKETTGSGITIPDLVSVSSRLSVEAAVDRACRHVAVPHDDEQGRHDPFGEAMPLTEIDLTGFKPQVITAFPTPEQPTVLESGPFGDRIKASLLWFLHHDDLQLTWEVLVTLPNDEGQYRTLVDIQNGQILYCRQLNLSITARGNVYHVDGGSNRQMTDFPKPVASYGLPVPNDLPAGFPEPWVETSQSLGNNTHAHLGASGDPVFGTNQNGVMTFNPSNASGDDQKVLNIFYYNCFMHDYFYLLGFREADGNFQRDNFGRGGRGFDRVDARAHSGTVFGTANMSTRNDGMNPVMNMGLVSSTNRHTAMDSSVVFHEFMHGVTNRLVGGPANTRALEAPQSGGMGEGWSDYIPCTINSTTVVGDWVVNRQGGIRGFPYDTNFPDHFGKLGSGRYSEVHNIGEIWAATLLEMNRNIGAVLGVQLVVDALKLTPANPGFLDARDGILSALDDRRDAGLLTQAEYETTRNGIWQAFAKFGMGPDARSNGASLSGIVADFSLPSPPEPPSPPSPPSTSDIHVETMPNLSIPDAQTVGVESVLTVSESGRIKTISVSVKITHTYIGDLLVTLISPQGNRVILHSRMGGSTNNLFKVYRSDDVPSLAALIGEEAQGSWRLHIADLAGLDLGQLDRWSIDLSLEAVTQVVRNSATPGLSIPDNDPAGVSSQIQIALSGTVEGVKVGIDITHTYIGDLKVELVSPSGQRAILHQQSGGSQDNLIRTYDSLTSPALSPLMGESTQGDWVLEVRDLLGQDVGKFNQWDLELMVR